MRYSIRYFRHGTRYSFLMTRGGLELPTSILTYPDFDSARAGAYSTLCATVRLHKDFTVFSVDENPNPRNISRSQQHSPILFDPTHSNFYRPARPAAAPRTKPVPLRLSLEDY